MFKIIFKKRAKKLFFVVVYIISIIILIFYAGKINKLDINSCVYVINRLILVLDWQDCHQINYCINLYFGV